MALKHIPFSLPVRDAVISGDIIPNEKSDKFKCEKVAIICHGYTAMRTADYKYVKIFYDLGFNVVIFDERCFGLKKSSVRNACSEAL